MKDSQMKESEVQYLRDSLVFNMESKMSLLDMDMQSGKIDFGVQRSRQKIHMNS